MNLTDRIELTAGGPGSGRHPGGGGSSTYMRNPAENYGPEHGWETFSNPHHAIARAQERAKGGEHVSVASNGGDHHVFPSSSVQQYVPGKDENAL